MVIGIALALAAMVLPSLAAGEEAEPRRFESIETHMGSPFKILLYTDDEALARRAFRAGFARIAALDRALSDYDPESELMRLCDRAGGPPVVVSDDLLDVLARAIAMAERSDGAYDPTIAPVVRLWRRARREKRLPDPDLLRDALGRVGYRKVTIDRGARTVRLEPGVKLDLGGIAKGYASQAAIEAIRHVGVSHALVAGAGDIVAGDAPPGRAGWSVAIAPLGADEGSARSGAISLVNAAVSTSGDAEQFVEIGGVRYSHIVDPKTGLGLTVRSSVTVVSPDGGTSDALDTAACVLGPERGLRLIAATPEAEGLFVRIGPAGVERTTTKGFGSLSRSGSESKDGEGVGLQGNRP